VVPVALHPGATSSAAAAAATTLGMATTPASVTRR